MNEIYENLTETLKLNHDYSGMNIKHHVHGFQVLVVRVDIGVVTYEAMTHQCGRSVVQVLVVRVDIGVLTY